MCKTKIKIMYKKNKNGETEHIKQEKLQMENLIKFLKK